MPRPKPARRLTLEALEDRRVCAAGLAAQVDTSHVLIYEFFDTSLTAYVQQVGGGKDIVWVDGSGFDDVVTITAVNPAKGNVTVRLQVLAGDSPYSSDRTVTLHSDHLYAFQPVAVFGNGGNDTLMNNAAARVQMYGGEGNDYLSGSSNTDLLYGGPGDDTLMGRGGLDGLYGGAGNDYLRGGPGNDNLYGGDDDDDLYGEDGNDHVNGEGGNDLLFGDADGSGAGNDTLYGGVGDDTLHGGGGNDALYGDNVDADDSDGNDQLFGEAGNDTLRGGGGNDYLDGARGADWLYGEDGVDKLYGGSGNDHLDGGYNDPDLQCDYLEGDTGADTFVRHRYAHTFGFVDDADFFADLHPGQGDQEESDWHL